MKARFIQENVILSVYEGPYGINPLSDWTGMSVMQIYEKEYPNRKIMVHTSEARILNVGDWAQQYYILAEAKNES
jgi:hypothetical protein